VAVADTARWLSRDLDLTVFVGGRQRQGTSPPGAEQLLSLRWDYLGSDEMSEIFFISAQEKSHVRVAIQSLNLKRVIAISIPTTTI